LPSGENTGSETPVGNDVSWRGSPPSIGIRKSCPAPARFELNSSERPSGVNCGAVS
jgi:hypothetical protein